VFAAKPVTAKTYSREKQWKWHWNKNWNAI